MLERRSLKLPIIMGVTMILLLVALTVGWVILTAFGASANSNWKPFYYTLLSVGTVFLVLVLVGVVMYLSLSIKAINLTRRQSNFIDSVTHELKSPIASLKLYLQTLSRHAVGEDQRERFYATMLDDVERLDQLINHLLEAGRMEREAVDEEEEEVSVLELLQDCVDPICQRYRVPPETLRLEVQPCLVRGRRVDLDMIFRNLIDNAVKYADDEQPRVTVSARPAAPGWIAVLVGDNGRGIPAPQRRKIFGRFVRLGMELERDKPGTGLGLYIVRTLIGRMRGRIRVRDPEQGTGTVFEVQLRGRPRPVPESAGASSEETAPAEISSNLR